MHESNGFVLPRYFIVFFLAHVAAKKIGFRYSITTYIYRDVSSRDTQECHGARSKLKDVDLRQIPTLHGDLLDGSFPNGRYVMTSYVVKVIPNEASLVTATADARGKESIHC